MSKKRLDKICRKFQRKTQKVVDESDSITGISIEIGGVKTTIAEKKSEDKDNE